MSKKNKSRHAMAVVLPQIKKTRPYPTPPMVSSMKVLYVGGVNSTGGRAMEIAAQGFVVKAPRITSSGGTALTAWLTPGFLHGVTGLDGYKSQLYGEVTSQLGDFMPDLIIGSSQGGAIAMMLSRHFTNADLLLLAPAYRTFDVEPVVKPETVIIHGSRDWIVPVRDSKSLASRNKCKLVVVNDGHHMPDSLVTIIEEIDRISMLRGQHKPEVQIKAEWVQYRKDVAEWLKDFGPKMAFNVISPDVP